MTSCSILKQAIEHTSQDDDDVLEVNSLSALTDTHQQYILITAVTILAATKNGKTIKEKAVLDSG